MKEFIRKLIEAGNYRLDDMQERITRVYLTGQITADDMAELLQLAEDKVDDLKQVDVLAMIMDIDERLRVVESKGVVVWKSGMVTAKGQTVLFDLGDGHLSYCRYDGGRATTSSSPGKISGWVKTDANGNPTHTISREGTEIILTPIETEPEVTPEPEA